MRAPVSNPDILEQIRIQCTVKPLYIDRPYHRLEEVHLEMGGGGRFYGIRKYHYNGIVGIQIKRST